VVRLTGRRRELVTMNAAAPIPNPLCVIPEGVGFVKCRLAVGESDFEARRCVISVLLILDRVGWCLTRCGLLAASPGVLGCRSSLLRPRRVRGMVSFGVRSGGRNQGDDLAAMGGHDTIAFAAWPRCW
jgi:hypothetical protein